MWLGKVMTDKGETPYFINFGIMEQASCLNPSLRRRVKRENI